MASIFDRYGIKEVADVTFYKINSNGSIGDAVLYLDTLKVSTIEQTAENTSARGGKGNPELIIWDYGKEITVTLEDALFSAKSMSMMFGDDIDEDLTTVERSFRYDQMILDSTGGLKGVRINGKEYAAPTAVTYYDMAGAKTTTMPDKDDFNFAVGTFEVADTVKRIVISAEKFPGFYRVVGDTYARNENSGEDEFFQFVINKAKMQSEVTLTMEAEGDPSTFNMNLKVMRPKNGEMIELIKYDLSTPNA